MSYIASNKIEVFPVAKNRIDSAPGTRIFTEKNISNLSRQLLSGNKHGYIISCDDKGDGLFDISFNLYGYYFNIVDFNPSTFGKTSIYASVIIEDEEIKGQDTESSNGSYEYQGLNITASVPSIEANEGLKFMQLLEYVNGAWRCVQQNFGLLSALVIGGIDGKHS